jgi:hypothetical protein
MELLRAQLMNAVERTYYQVLEDPLFAMSDVTPLDILNHLTTEYGTLSPADILKNQAKLVEAWNAESPIEDLWKKIDNVKAVAKAANAEISDGTTIELTLIALKAVGVYDHLISTWLDKPKANRTYCNFQAHVNLQDDTRLETGKTHRCYGRISCCQWRHRTGPQPCICSHRCSHHTCGTSPSHHRWRRKHSLLPYACFPKVAPQQIVTPPQCAD